MAAAQVVRHMDGAPLVPVSYAFAVQAVGVERRRHRSAEFNEKTPRRVKRAVEKTEPLTKIEAQTLAGIELDLSQSVIARNLGVSESQIEDAVKTLRKRGLL